MTHQRSKQETMFRIPIWIPLVLVGVLAYQLSGIDGGRIIAIAASPFRHPVASQVMFWVAVFTIPIGGILAFLMESLRIPILCLSAFVLLTTYVAAFNAMSFL